METYSTKQLARLSGISREQLGRWDRDGLLQAARTHKGLNSERAYTRDQALGVIALAELQRAGVSERRIRAASAALPQSIAEYAFLVFDGHLLYAKQTAEEVTDCIGQMPNGGRVLKVGNLKARLKGNWASSESAHPETSELSTHEEGQKA